MVVGLIALVSAACFLGAAFYINFAEHIGRMGLSPDSAVRQWAPAYSRGYMMQASLALLSGVAGLLAGWESGNGNWFAGAALMLANWPWTMLAIMPVNRRLLAISAESPVADDREAIMLLARWSERHAVRTALSLMALVAFSFAMIAW